MMRCVQQAAQVSEHPLSLLACIAFDIQVLDSISRGQEITSAQQPVAVNLVRRGLLWKDGTRDFHFVSELHQ